MAAPGFDDYLAICDVKARYCRCLDTKDWAGYADVFTEDFEMDVRGAGGTVVHGRDAVVAMVSTSLADTKTAHHVHSPEIDVEGDTAEVVWAMRDRVVWPAERAATLGHAGLTGYGHYHERYVRKDGQWRIAAQRLVRLHIDIDPLPAA